MQYGGTRHVFLSGRDSAVSLLGGEARANPRRGVVAIGLSGYDRDSRSEFGGVSCTGGPNRFFFTAAGACRARATRAARGSVPISKTDRARTSVR